MTAHFELALAGAGGEPVDLRRTISSHGLASLPPMEPAPDDVRLTVTLPLSTGRPRIVSIEQRRAGRARVTVAGRRPGARSIAELKGKVGHLLRLDDDLSEFYARAAEDPDLAWATAGAGRMLRSATVFEEVVKTVCTTNCAWSGTVRMVTALVEHLGEPAAGAPPEGWRGRAFPSPHAMAAAPESFYRDVARAGYRGVYLIALASAQANGDIDLEAWGNVSRDELPDDELEERLLALPGVGPYAAAHIMLMLGRYSRLILDSWTRPTYARLARKKAVKDPSIVRRFKRYGPYAGLAFWLYLTRSWVAET